MAMKLLPQITTYAVVEDIGLAPDGVTKTQIVQFEVNPDGLICPKGGDTWFTKESLKDYFKFCGRAVELLPLVLMCLLLTGCWSPFWEHTPTIGKGPTINLLSKSIKLIGQPLPPGMTAQTDLATASAKPPCAGKSIITTNSTGYCFTNPCSLTSGCVTTQPPKTNVTITADADGFLEYATTASGPFTAYSAFDRIAAVPLSLAQSAMFRLRQDLTVLVNYGPASMAYTNIAVSTNGQAAIRTVPGAMYYAAACVSDDLKHKSPLTAEVSWKATGTNTVLAWNAPAAAQLTIK